MDQAGDVQAAIGNAATTLGLATAVGGMAGGLAGAAIGCPLGALTGGTLMVPTVVGTPLGLVGGCLIGASVVGSTGAILGGAVLGVPAVIAGAGQVLGALREPVGADAGVATDTGVPATTDAAQ
ncbi:hypothetical protein EBN03_23310 [Nocardia stercoris]|uniref:Uncharacterized protein n=1 Tax=Nocardia stercoris TaxID=2483361 RepID=A0A3M2L0X3_9NOCA|nr:hypothetical protein EBN03_23310 [Nocardia stercoris]